MVRRGNDPLALGDLHSTFDRLYLVNPFTFIPRHNYNTSTLITPTTMTDVQVDLKKQAPPTDTAAEKPEEKGLPEDAVNKYTSAGQVVTDVVKKFVPSVIAGKKVSELCIE